MAKVAVLPVPDCAWAITSYPVWVCGVGWGVCVGGVWCVGVDGMGVSRWDDEEKIQHISAVMSYTDL